MRHPSSTHPETWTDGADERVARLVAFSRSPVGRGIIATLVHYFDARLVHAERIPQTGAALLVSNHAAFGIDSFVLASLILEKRGRHARFLVERNLARYVPFRAFFRAVAALPGSQIAAIHALEQGELVGVYPGGIDESLKLSHHRQRLRWGERTGFARAAMHARVPIVPIAGVGIDDVYRVVARERVLGRRLFGSERYDLPIAFGAFGTPLPRRARMRFVVLPPIDTTGDPADPSAVRRVREATHDVIDRELARDR